MVVTSCMSRFSLVDLARMSSSSKALKELFLRQLNDNSNLTPHALMRQCVTEASAAFPWANSYYHVRQCRYRESAGVTAGVQHRMFRQSFKALQWLLHTSHTRYFANQDDPVVAETKRTMLYTSYMPGPHALLLVAAGLRFSHAEFLAAARAGVNGLWVWVAACEKLGVDSGLPGWVEEQVGLHRKYQPEVSAVLAESRVRQRAACHILCFLCVS